MSTEILFILAEAVILGMSAGLLFVVAEIVSRGELIGPSPADVDDEDVDDLDAIVVVAKIVAELKI